MCGAIRRGHREALVRKIEEYAIAVALDDFIAPEVYVVRECPAVANRDLKARARRFTLFC